MWHHPNDVDSTSLGWFHFSVGESQEGRGQHLWGTFSFESVVDQQSGQIKCQELAWIWGSRVTRQVSLLGELSSAAWSSSTCLRRSWPSLFASSSIFVWLRPHSACRRLRWLMTAIPERVSAATPPPRSVSLRGRSASRGWAVLTSVCQCWWVLALPRGFIGHCRADVHFRLWS